MISLVVTAVVCLLAIAVAVRRLATVRTGRFAHYFSLALMCWAAGKLARLPVVSDELIDGWFHTMTGVWNVTDFTGMLLAVLGAIFMVNAVAGVVGRPIPVWAMLTTLPVAAASMLLGFALSPVPHTPTEFMSRDFAFTGWFAFYWAVYLLYLGVPAAMSMVLSARAVTVLRPGQVRRALGSVVVAAAAASGYVVHKLVTLIVERAEVWAGYRAWAPQVSLVLVLTTILALLVGILPLAVAATRRRWSRFALLREGVADWEAVHAHSPSLTLDRSLLPAHGRLSLWRAAKDPVTTNRMLIELADAGAPRPRAGSLPG